MPSRVSRIIPCPASIQAPGEGGKPSLPGGSAYRLRYSARDTTPGSSRGGLPARSGLGGFVAAGGEAFEEFAGGFVVGGLRHEFAPEGLGEQGGDELPDLSAGSSDAGFEAAGEGEEGFCAADDFVVILQQGDWKNDLLSSVCAQDPDRQRHGCSAATARSISVNSACAAG